MATKKTGNGNLESAMALLIQNQAQFLERAATTDRELLELKKQIGDRLNNIEALLIRHDQILKDLPEAIRKTK